jgi:hypothetical protein
MTSLKGGRGMSQFLDRGFFDYGFTLRPNDRVRSIVRIPFLNLELVPYFIGSDISVKLRIKPTSKAKPNILCYEWRLFKKNSPDLVNSGKGVADMTKTNDHKTNLFLTHFSYTDEYSVDMNVTANGQTESQSQTMLDLEITSRASVMMNWWWLVLGGAVGFLLGKIT